MKAVAHRRLPGNLLRFWKRSLTAKEIYPQEIARRWRAVIDRRVWNSHCAVPDMRVPIDTRGDFESGVPGPATFVMRIVEIDIEIDPFTLRRKLEFFVALYVFKV